MVFLFCVNNQHALVDVSLLQQPIIISYLEYVNNFKTNEEGNEKNSHRKVENDCNTEPVCSNWPRNLAIVESIPFGPIYL